MRERSVRSRRSAHAVGAAAILPAVIAIGGLLSRGAASSPAPALAVAGEKPAAGPADAEAGSRQKPPSRVFGDAWLRGRVDLSRRVLDGDRFRVPLAGDGGGDAWLTLDPALQARAEALIAEADAPYAAIVVMRPDGRLLAIAAASTADPKLGLTELALSPWAPSASIFKIVTAAALLDAGLSPESKACYHGGLRSVEPQNLVDDPEKDTACETLAYGLAKSQNALMAKLTAKHLSAASLRAAATALGYDLPVEFALPTRPSTFTPPAEPLELARAAAGFWHSELSVLDGALLAATVANGGLRVTPRVVASVRTGDGGEELPLPGLAPRRVLDPDTAEMVGEMMVHTTEWGTAHKAFHDQKGRRWLGDVRVAGKTGSLSRREPSYVNHSWFVGYAPAEAPQVVVAVLLGNSATWRFKAHTVARLLLADALGVTP